jgi:cobyrinic acid a,c-diamide synthase
MSEKGIRVQPFKVGPDFIDPGLHEIAAGAPSHNLDGWMLTREANESLFARACAGKDIAVVEGVMGLFDGFDGKSDSGSSAEIAKWLDLPVVLVIDASGMARSAAAVVHGMRAFDPGLRIAGVIFNRVAGEGHYRILRDAVQDVPILGWLPAEPAVEIPERHLGLFTGQEEIARDRIRKLGGFVAKHIDVHALLNTLPAISAPAGPAAPPATEHARRRRVAVALDKAFSFYYQANLLELERAGADIVRFSPLEDRELPAADVVYIGGGYPELYCRELEANESMRASVADFIKSGGRFYAECGGLMYLARSIDGASMVGWLPVDIERTGRLVDFGYCEVSTSGSSILGPSGTRVRGHQFHYSRIKGPYSSRPVYDVVQKSREYSEGFLFENGIASYIHLHFLSNPAIARNMLES